MSYLHMYSYGGVGTRMLYEWLKPHYGGITDQGGVHYRKPSLPTMTADDSILYLYGDPVDAVCSFFNKNMKDGKFIQQHCQNLKIPTVPPSVENYVASGKDKFYLFDHFRRYRDLLLGNQSCAAKIVFIHHDSLWDDQDEFLSYLNLSHLQEQFPVKSSRSTKSWLTQGIKDGLEDIYKDMKTEMGKINGLVCK